MPGLYCTLMSDLTTSISQAMMLATRLRSMSERLKDGDFKRVADALLLELAEVQLKLGEVMAENASLKGRAKSQQGECCPRCGELGWHVASTKAHKTPGVVVQVSVCPKCKLKEESLIKA
jgi:hypothetical protein